MKNRFNLRLPQAILSILLVLSTFFVSAQEIEGDVAKGKSIFNAKCAACHKLNKKSIGPALAGVTERRTREWLQKWIRNNVEFRASGDADAIAIFEEYKGSLMTPFPGLTDEDIDNVLAYTAAAPPPPKTPEYIPGQESADTDNTMVLIILGSILFFLVFLLTRVKNTLKAVKGDPTSTIAEDADRITRTALKNPKITTLLTILIAIVFLQQLYLGLMEIGLKQDYQPDQPIKFSHKLHAGDNQIDCNYCHYGARKGKHSNIPSASVCMNCHMNISEGPNYGETEIAKIYDAVGWDSENAKYIENYEVKPIKWIRIHNLPDLAYFNHSQHVTAGQVACETCHGAVKEMEEVYQYSPLTMGWCINCHRETKVKVESNEYYTQMHEKLKEKFGDDAEITVEMIGGLECGKCHY